MQFAIIFITSALQKLCKVFKSREILRDNFEQDILALFLPKCNIYIYIYDKNCNIILRYVCCSHKTDVEVLFHFLPFLTAKLLRDIRLPLFITASIPTNPLMSQNSLEACHIHDVISRGIVTLFSCVNQYYEMFQRSKTPCFTLIPYYY